MKKLFGALALLAGASFGAQANVTFDFTDSSTFGGADGQSVFSTSSNGIDIRLTSTGGNMTFNSPFDGAVVPDGLAGDGDGIGVGRDDEVSEGVETLLVEFTNQAVNLVTVGFLDLFITAENEQELLNGDAGIETAVLTFSNNMVLEIEAVENIDSAVNGGYRLFDFTSIPPIHNGLGVTSILFEAKVSNNDNVGVGDFSLASLMVRPVPEPATWLMMIIGFAGLAMVIRRRRVAGLSV